MAAAQAGHDAAQMPFIKNLASSDRKLRTASLESLQTFLSSRRTLTEQDARKLWTGLYYALWMTDRPKPQQSLANDLAELLFSLNSGPECAAPWLRAFWHVLGAQWTSIEALRLDKFLLLVRRVFSAQLRYAKKYSFKGDHGKLVEDVLKDYCFDGHGGASGLGILPLGLRLHVLDLWVDELEREGLLSGDQDADESKQVAAQREQFVKAVGHMVDALRSSPVKAVQDRARESYDDERLPWASKDGQDRDQDEDQDTQGAKEGGAEDDEEWGGLDD